MIPDGWESGELCCGYCGEPFSDEWSLDDLPDECDWCGEPVEEIPGPLRAPGRPDRWTARERAAYAERMAPLGCPVACDIADEEGER